MMEERTCYGQNEPITKEERRGKRGKLRKVEGEGGWIRGGGRRG
jgi:hypothetical protein